MRRFDERFLSAVVFVVFLGLMHLAGSQHSDRKDPSEGQTTVADMSSNQLPEDLLQQVEDEEQPKEAKDKQEPKIPPALQRYMGRRIARTMHYAGAEWLIRDTREREERCS